MLGRSPLRILMLGTGPFAVPTFQDLLESAHEVTALVTRPVPAPRGRRTSGSNPMRDVAEARGLPVHAPASVNSPEAEGIIRGEQPDLLVVCDYGQILSKDSLALAPLGGINLHGSLLPRHRGAAPVNWALLAGDAQTGVSVIHMTPRLDGGPVISHRVTEIGADEDAVGLETRLALLGVEAVREAVQKLVEWDGNSPLGQPQDPAQATRAPRLAKSDACLDWQLPAEVLANRVRGLKPWPGTYTTWIHRGSTQRLIVHEVAVVREAEANSRSLAAPGEIVREADAAIWVQTGRGCLALKQVQPAGKRLMSAAEFLRGHALPVGAHLGETTEE